MQQAYVQKLSQSCLQLHLVPVPASSFRQHIAQAYSIPRRTPRSLLGITQASSAHLSHDTASSQQATVAEQPFVPLTKARKKKKQAHAFIPPAILGSSWQKAGNVAGYFAWAVGAGLAITALDIDIADVALASAAIAAGEECSNMLPQQQMRVSICALHISIYHTCDILDKHSCDQ